MAVTRSIPALAAGEHVHVHLPQIGLLPATVEAVEPGALVLALAVRDERVKRLGGADVAVQHTTRRGIDRYAGTLQVEGGVAEQLRVHLEGGAERIQRRDWARVEAVLEITVRGVDEPVGGRTHTLNVSGGGVLVRDPWRLPIGLDVSLELQLDTGGPPVRGLGRVVRSPAPDQKGIRIDSIAREDEERLVRLVRERELAALRTATDR